MNQRQRERRFVRSSEAETILLSMSGPWSEQPEEAFLALELQEKVQIVLQKVPSKLRAVLVLKYYFDFMHEETAIALKLPPKLVKSRLHQAIGHFKTLYGTPPRLA